MRSLISSLWPYLRPRRVTLTLGLLCAVATSALGQIIPWLLGRSLDAIDRTARTGASLTPVYVLCGVIIIVALVAGVFRYEMRELLNGASRWVEYDLRNALFKHLERLDASYYGRTRTGDIMARLTNDLSAVRTAAGPAVMYLANTVSGGLIALGFMIYISPRLTALAVLPMLVLPVVMLRLGRAIHNQFEAVQEQFSAMTTRAQENLSGTRIVRAYRQERAEVARFAALNDEYLVRNMRLASLNGAMGPGFSVLAGLGAVIVMGVGLTFVLYHRISLGEFLSFGIYLAGLTWPLISLGYTTNLFERGAASMTRLNEIFAAVPAVRDPAHPRALPKLAPGVRGRTLEFRNVGFHYPTREGHNARWVLRNISFKLPAGATLGVVGSTGSGKSALIDLIPRVYDPQEGEILLDGVPIQELELGALRREIGVVPQESLLFSDTIGSNMAYGRDESPSPAEGVASSANGSAPVSTADRNADQDEEVEETWDDGIDPDVRWAARVAQLDTTIASFPGGYEAMLGERGINLSGGQKQRAALARALARRPALVLLDDSLSAVDTHTEAEILHALRDAVTGRTAVIASHRVSAIRDATWIIVLDEGRIVEQGRHDELLALGGRYWSLLRRQQLVDAIETEEVA
jgi:ATP-binding cassette subfamily B protein